MIRALRRLVYWLRPHARESELCEELATHRAMIERDLSDRGMPTSAARDAARRAMGEIRWRTALVIRYAGRHASTR